MEENLKFLIIQFFFNRPVLIHNALKSIAAQTYTNFEVAFIDDSEGSPESRHMEYLFDRENLTYIHTNDTKEAKLARGGAIFGKFANEAMANSDADVCIMVCCDDFLHKDYLLNLNKFFTRHPEINYCYSDVMIYDPLTEKYEDVCEREVDRSYFLNSNIHPHCLGNSKDSSQVAWRRKCYTEGGCAFPWPLTHALDYHLYMQLYQKYGVGYYSGFVGQGKGVHSNQLGRTNSYDIQN
jgi:glycosyltransferase involved in cell wall biosynthesis